MVGYRTRWRGGGAVLRGGRGGGGRARAGGWTGRCNGSGGRHWGGGGAARGEGALVGEDPRQVERLYWKMYRISRQHLGGSAHRAMAGIELALWDIKARALGISVSELHGGPIRERQHIYWSHCGTVRAHNWEL